MKEYEQDGEQLSLRYLSDNYLSDNSCVCQFPFLQVERSCKRMRHEEEDRVAEEGALNDESDTIAAAAAFFSSCKTKTRMQALGKVG